MPFILGGIAIAGAVMGGMGQSAEAQAAEVQQREQQFREKMKVQQQNREIAKKNAQRWMNNRKIAEAASQQRAEEDFYIRYNYNNETNLFSRNVKRTNDMIASKLAGKNIRGQTAKQLMRQSLEGAKTAMASRRVAFENQLQASARKQQAMLNRRDFGYNNAISYIPGAINTANTKGIMTNALATGIMSGVTTYVSTDRMDQFYADALNIPQGDVAAAAG